MLGITRDGDVTTIELQREQRRNALDERLVLELRDALTSASQQARAIVLAGQGPVFCSGADLDVVYSETFVTVLQELLQEMQTISVPVIAAIHGGAIGAGVQLAMAADLRVMAPDSYLAVPAAKLGISVDGWTVRRLVSLLGGGPARTILLGAQPISARDAYTYGFANRLGTLADAQQWAASIAELAPLSLEHMKLVLEDDGSRQPDSTAQQSALLAAWKSEDAQEGRVARKEKRAARFVGR